MKVYILRYRSIIFNALPRAWNDKRHFIDIAVAIFIFIFAGISSVSFLKHTNIKPGFYQRRFAPAVMQACGRGFVRPNLSEAPKLRQFLSLESEEFECKDIPDGITIEPLDLFQSGQRYLMSSVAAIWYISGISWKKLGPLYFLLSGITISFGYLLMRIASGRIIALAGALFIVHSIIYLRNLPHLRDFAKAPFIYGLVLVLAYALIKRHKVRKMLWLSALYGLIFGIGLGFRMDLILFAPIFILSIIVFAPRGFAKPLKCRIYCIVVFLFATLLSGGVILKAFTNGSNTYHVALLGLMDPFDKDLGLEKNYYSFGYRYNDSYVKTILDDYSRRIHGSVCPVPMCSNEYENTGKEYFFSLVKKFPADMIIRSYASTLKILELPYRITGFSLSNSRTISIVIAVFSFAALINYSIRLSVFALVMILFLTGYPALQFHERHFFHLLIVPVWLISIVCQQVFVLGRSVYQTAVNWISTERIIPSLRKINFISIGIVLCGSFVVVVGSLYLARYFQNRNLHSIFKEYIESEKEPLSVIEEPVSEEDRLLRFLIQDEPILNQGDSAIQSEYVAFRINRHGFHTEHISYILRYSFGEPQFNYSTKVTALVDTWNFMPVYRLSHAKFEGIVVAKKYRPCFEKFFRIKGTNELPILYSLNLPYNITPIKLFRTLRSDKDDRIISNTIPDKGEILYIASIKEYIPLIGKSKYSDPITRIASGYIEGKGRPKTKNAYLFVSDIMTKTDENYLIAEGIIRRGNLTVGALKDNMWYALATIQDKGPFTIVLMLSEKSAMPLIASADSRKLDFTIKKFHLYDPHHSVSSVEVNTPREPDFVRE